MGSKKKKGGSANNKNNKKKVGCAASAAGGSPSTKKQPRRECNKNRNKKKRRNGNVNDNDDDDVRLRQAVEGGTFYVVLCVRLDILLLCLSVPAAGAVLPAHSLSISLSFSLLYPLLDVFVCFFCNNNSSRR